VALAQTDSVYKEHDFCAGVVRELKLTRAQELDN
jgi:hypothetical protein